MPILTNPLTNEPYIPLPAPHSSIILTPARPPTNNPDSAALLSLLNSPQIYANLESTPVPYLPEHAAAWMQSSHEQDTAVLHAAKTNRFVDGMPFTCIREVVSPNPDGAGTGAGTSDVYIGNVSLRRYAFYEFKKGSPEREEAETRNAALGVGDARIVWGFGDYLAPTHHGKGIMTAVIKAVIEEWAVPRMNARVIKASAYADNRASVRVFEKNGFRLEYELEDWAVVPRDRRGGLKSIVVLVWEAAANKSEGGDTRVLIP